MGSSDAEDVPAKSGPDYQPHEAAKSESGSSARMGTYYLPRGVLTVRVIDVTELKGRTGFLGRYDPFVKITVGEQTAFSTVQRNAGSEPVWNEPFMFPLKLERNFFNHIKLQVIDRNIMTQHSLMGELSLVLEDRPECQTSSTWKIPVEENLSLECEEGLGQIRFSIQFQEKTAEEMLDLNMEDQNCGPPARGPRGEATRGGNIVVETISVIGVVVGIVSSMLEEDDEET